MNNIYVDELPKDCWNCQFLDKEYFNNCYCGICQKEFDDEDLYVSEESFEHKKAECCPLKPLTYRLAEERKRVVQEIRDWCDKNGIVVDTFFDYKILKRIESRMCYVHEINKQLNQIENGNKDES